MFKHGNEERIIISFLANILPAIHGIKQAIKKITLNSMDTGVFAI